MRHKPTVKAWVGEVEGRIIAIGGFYFNNGLWVGFADLKEEAHRYKVRFIKAARMMMDDMRLSGHRYIYAEADPNFPMAPRWIESLGFEMQASGLWRWQA